MDVDQVKTTNSKLLLKSSFKSVKTIDSIYTGGKVLVTNDESLLITTLNEDIVVTELSTGKQVHRLEGDTEIVTTMAVKPDSKHLVSASRSLQMRIWDLQTGQCIRTTKAHEAPVIVMDIDHSSTLVATGGADGVVKVWDIDRGFCTHVFNGHRGVVSAVKFHYMNGQWYLASGADDCEIRIWNLQTKKCIGVLQSHVSVIRGLDFSADGRTLISGSRDKVVNVWDWQSKQLKTTYPIYETLETVGFIATSTDLSAYDERWQNEELFYTGGDGGLVRIWDLKTGQLVQAQEKEENSKHTITDVIYSPKSQLLAAVTNDQNVLIYSIPQQLDRIKQIVGYNDQIVDIAYLGPDETHLGAVTNSQVLRVYNVETQDCELLYGHQDMIICVDRSRVDGTLFVTGAKDRTARLWKMELDQDSNKYKYECIGVCVGHTEAIGAVALPNKSTNFLLTGGQDRTVKYWHLQDLKKNDKPRALYTHQAHDKDINTIAIAPNDKVFATGSQDKLVKMWSVDSGELLGTCKGHKRGVWSVQFSPVDQVIATSSGDKTVKLWNVRNFTCIKTFEGHTNSVLRVDFLTAGMQLVSSGSDGLLKVWTIKTNECETTMDNHTEKVWALAVRKDQRYIASAGADSVVNFWEDVTREEQEQELKEKEDFIIKEQELQNFMHKKDYLNAILLALSLEQPYRLLALFKTVMEENSQPGSITGSTAVDTILAEMGTQNLEKLLGYIRDWNTNAKHAHVAQTILNGILSTHSSEEIVELANAKEIIDGLLPYTDRHFQRLDDFITQSYIVDYTLHAQKS
ncbi:WD40-repeat-containing domain protein [Zychaea mexicana]|uniref:WD40-repeat-containing domain protein n=1 Tax=Zychaea mexicana TaxID=64656 RepID=UPI0022FEAEB0|nr:WD40-repeat-containing domain protein [Zychaea mexicana]KAI9499124.1 WD40-repeat-containing domain protein [Zychaea mexicana]